MRGCRTRARPARSRLPTRTSSRVQARLRIGRGGPSASGGRSATTGSMTQSSSSIRSRRPGHHSPSAGCCIRPRTPRSTLPGLPCTLRRSNGLATRAGRWPPGSCSPERLPWIRSPVRACNSSSTTETTKKDGTLEAVITKRGARHAEPGAWRIEVSPAQHERRAHFLIGREKRSDGSTACATGYTDPGDQPPTRPNESRRRDVRYSESFASAHARLRYRPDVLVHFARGRSPP